MKREVKLVGLSYSHSQVGSYTVILTEVNGHRKLPLIVKTHDAQIIMMRSEGMTFPRPLTQDIVKSLTDGFNIRCSEIYIYQILEGIFYTRASFDNGIDDTVVEITAGEAVSMSILYDCPLYVSEDVLSICGIYTDEDGVVIDEDDHHQVIPKEEKISLEDLKSMMSDALRDEDYEVAAKLRDEIAKKESSSK